MKQSLLAGTVDNITCIVICFNNLKNFLHYKFSDFVNQRKDYSPVKEKQIPNVSASVEEIRKRLSDKKYEKYELKANENLNFFHLAFVTLKTNENKPKTSNDAIKLRHEVNPLLKQYAKKNNYKGINNNNNSNNNKSINNEIILSVETDNESPNKLILTDSDKKENKNTFRITAKNNNHFQLNAISSFNSNLQAMKSTKALNIPKKANNNAIAADKSGLTKEIISVNNYHNSQSLGNRNTSGEYINNKEAIKILSFKSIRIDNPVESFTSSKKLFSSVKNNGNNTRKFNFTNCGNLKNLNFNKSKNCKSSGINHSREAAGIANNTNIIIEASQKSENTLYEKMKNINIIKNVTANNFIDKPYSTNNANAFNNNSKSNSFAKPGISNKIKIFPDILGNKKSPQNFISQQRKNLNFQPKEKLNIYKFTKTTSSFNSNNGININTINLNCDPIANKSSHISQGNFPKNLSIKINSNKNT